MSDGSTPEEKSVKVGKIEGKPVGGDPNENENRQQHAKNRKDLPRGCGPIQRGFASFPFLILSEGGSYLWLVSLIQTACFSGSGPVIRKKQQKRPYLPELMSRVRGGQKTPDLLRGLLQDAFRLDEGDPDISFPLITEGPSWG